MKIKRINEQTELFQSHFTGIVKPKKTREVSEFTKFKHDLYEQYKINMKQFGKGKEVVSYRKWLQEICNREHLKGSNQ